MRLSSFILTNKEPILQEWEDFARTIQPAALTMEVAALRDHASLILDEVSAQLESPASAKETFDKSRGNAPRVSGTTHAENHATERLHAGFTVDQLVSEYRALRASVLKQWAAASSNAAETNPHDIMRFNEAIDQALAESVAQFSRMLRVAEDKLKQVDQRKDEFLAMLAHELRNPLAPISTAAEILRMDGIGVETVGQASRIISRQVSHMTRLVDDLLDVSRVTRGLVTLKVETLDLRQVLNAAVEQTRPRIDAGRHRLAVHMTASETFVEGDRTRLVQVIANLLVNAAKYTAEGGEIVVCLEVRGSDAVLSVADTGIGIDPKLMPHIYDLFTQGEHRPAGSQGGLGVGLALVKSLTELHRGSVTATSMPGQGSTFTVVLPLRPAPTPRPARTKGTGTAKANALQVMLVDDNVDAAVMLAFRLRREGHDVTMKHDAKSSLAHSSDVETDVFILDIGLPDLDGYELARTLRGRAGASGATFIALTGYGQARDRERSQEAGFDHHFVKPIDGDKLTQLLAELRGARREPSIGSY